MLCRCCTEKSQSCPVRVRAVVPVPGYGYEFYRSHRSFAYGYIFLAELREVSGGVFFSFRTYRSFGYGEFFLTELTKVLGIAWVLYRTHRSLGKDTTPDALTCTRTGVKIYTRT